VSRFELYRYTHPDGGAKEWAWCSEPGVGIEVRRGRAGQEKPDVLPDLSRIDTGRDDYWF
jgi:hypothetical protein